MKSVLPLQRYPCFMTPQSCKRADTKSQGWVEERTVNPSEWMGLTANTREATDKPGRCTHKTTAGVAKGGLLIGGLVEVVQKVEAQLGANWHPALEVGGDFVPADLSFSEGGVETRWERPKQQWDTAFHVGMCTGEGTWAPALFASMSKSVLFHQVENVSI